MDSIERHAQEVAARMKAVDPLDIAESKKLKQEAVIESVRRGATIADAAGEAGISRQMVYNYRNECPEFRERFDTARAEGLKQAEIRIAELTSDCRIKAIETLHDAMDGKRMNRQALTAAIFTAKAKLGWTETSRVESVEVVPIIDDIPRDA